MNKFWDWLKSIWHHIIDPGFVPVSVITLVAILLGLGAIALPYHGQDKWRDLATPILGAFACLAAGGAVGFLFGLPKVSPDGIPNGSAPHPPATADAGAAPAHAPRGNAAPAAGSQPAPAPARETPAAPAPQSPAGSAERPRLRVSRNLEEIADWLTKIVVGLGLVELKNIPTYLESMAGAFVEDLGAPCNRSYAMGLIVYFAVMGFLYGYVATRMFLSPAFDRADGQLARSDLQKIKELEVRVGNAATRESVDEQTKANLINAGILAWYHFNPGDPSFDKPYEELSKMIREYPDNRAFNIIFGNLNLKKRDFARAIQVAEDAIKAIEARRGVADPTAIKDVADFRFNLACYRARMYEDTVDPAKKNKAADECFSDLEKSLEKSPENYEDAIRDHDLDPVRSNTRYAPILEKGIAFCSERIQNIERLRTPENKRQIDKQLSDLHFLLARGYAQKFKATASEADKGTFATKCVENLTKSVDLRPDSREAKEVRKKAHEEPDFAVLAENTAFKTLVQDA